MSAYFEKAQEMEGQAWEKFCKRIWDEFIKLLGWGSVDSPDRKNWAALTKTPPRKINLAFGH